MKTVLEFKYMPSNCVECILIRREGKEWICGGCTRNVVVSYINSNERHHWCPLKEVEENTYNNFALSAIVKLQEKQIENLRLEIKQLRQLLDKASQILQDTDFEEQSKAIDCEAEL